MKKIVLFLALVSLVFLISCKKSETSVVIELVGKKYLVLKPQPLATEGGLKKIFLRKSGDRYDWYKKADNSYQLYSLRNEQKDYLNPDLAYEIVDTVYTDKDYEADKMKTAYTNGSSIINTDRDRTPLKKYWFTKTKTITKDSLLSYDKTKNLFTSSSKTRSEIKTDLGPIITIFFFLIFGAFFTSGDRIWWMREIREKIIFSTFGRYSLQAEHILNSSILFIFTFVFNITFCLIYNYLEIWTDIIFAAIISSFILIIFQITHWIDTKLNKLTKALDGLETFSFILIILTYQIELTVFSVNENFVLYSAISLALFLLVFDIYSFIASRRDALILAGLIEESKRQRERIEFLKKDDQ